MKNKHTKCAEKIPQKLTCPNRHKQYMGETDLGRNRGRKDTCVGKWGKDQHTLPTSNCEGRRETMPNKNNYEDVNASMAVRAVYHSTIWIKRVKWTQE